ncbi:MAG: beta-ketoacyl-ACP synthase 3, partial [Gammaproteobacteria bacterium]|nr:beta-ketoacyl-ACP synthase 3 [Gammaproteobacteria bacterium]
AGFNYGLAIADQFIRNKMIRHALVVGSEVMSSLLDWTDRSTCILFGDGAGAVVLKADQTPGILSTHLHADGHHHELLYVSPLRSGGPPLVKMRGNEVFKVAVNALGEVLTETLNANHLKPGDIDWLIPHQANMRIIAAMAKKLDMPMERVILTIEQHGNTSAASVPIALDVGVRSGKIKRGDRLLLESFGAGFAWGSALIQY